MSSMGDLFFPDNPNRRRRGKQLTLDIEQFCAEFERVKQIIDKEVLEIKLRLDEVLKKNGYETIDDLGTAVENILSGYTLRQWRELTKKFVPYHVDEQLVTGTVLMECQYSIDLSSDIESIAFIVCGLVTVATGVFLPDAYFLGLIFGAAAISATTTIGAVLAIVGAVVIIWAIIDSGKERDNLREAIRSLAFARVDAIQALRQLEAYRQTLGRFKILWDDELLFEFPELLTNFMEGDFKEIMKQAERSEVIKELQEMDRLRPGGAWQKEDPDVTFPLAGANRTSSMHFTSIDDFIGQSTRAIAVSMTSSAEIIVRPRMKTQSYFDDRADYLILLQFDPAHTPDDGRTDVRDFSPFATIGPTASQVVDNNTNVKYRVDINTDPAFEETPDYSLVNITLKNLSSFVVSKHVGIRVVQTFTN